MDFLLENWYWLVAALASGALLLWPQIKGGAQGISPAEAVQLINREKGQVIDVGPSEDFAKGHIGGAKNVPLDSIGSAKGLPSNKTIPLVLCCSTGAKSAKAQGQLKALGHERVHVLKGGLASWRQANLPVEASA